jgi:glyoxylase-like metal-dependent hydrolase (beta-lactamase superfamily II)
VGPLSPTPGAGAVATQRSRPDRTASLMRSLAEIGATDVGVVLFTHLHSQQLAGLSALPGPIRCLFGHAERPSGSLRFLYSDPLAFASAVQEFNFEKAPEMAPLGPCIDIFGDGSLWAISTAGHTVGGVSYLVMDVNGPVLVAGRLAAGLRGPESAGDRGMHKELGRFSLQRLRDFLDLYPYVRLAPKLSRLNPASGAHTGGRTAPVLVADDEVAGGRFE